MLPASLGSVRQVVDADRNITLHTNYSPFGEVMESEGGQQSAFGFTGEQSDETGLLYLRARYNEPERGSFLSRDAWRGDRLNPQTFNPYSYVGGNPINITDPSGNCYGPLEWLRRLPIEDRNCIALDQSLYILGNANYSDSDKRWAGAYVRGWTVGHSYLFVGTGILGAKGAVASAGQLPAAVNAGRSVLSAGSGLISAVTRWGQSHLLRHPNMGNVIGAGMVVAGTVDDVAAVHAGVTGNPAAAGELITAGSVDGRLPFADVIAGIRYFGKNIAKASRCAFKTGPEELYMIGRPVSPIERTYYHRLDPQSYINDVVKKYGINLRGSGQKVEALYDHMLPRTQLGVTRKAEGGYIIRIGDGALVDEASTANTIAHELSHARDYLRGNHKPHGDYSSIGDETPYGSGNALEAYIRGER